MDTSLVLLSRIQFAFTISFHILYPAFSIGLITFIAFFEAIWIKTRNPIFLNICKFWMKILALTFGMGIVSGIVMEFQLGTNWSHYTQSTGNVLGVLFTYEVLTAFFIEAGFLGVMFFGWNRVSPPLHFAATLLALFGVTLSAFWIMSANSWMQYPSGVEYNNGIFKTKSWLDVIFNPLFLPRFFHMMLATYIASLLAILSICAHYLLNNRFTQFTKICFPVAFLSLMVLIPLQLIVGDQVGLKIFHYQPIKTAAIEGLWKTQRGAPLLLFAIPSQQAEKNYFEVGVPKLASYINTHELNGELVGLQSVSPEERPNVLAVFYSFRIMVGMWVIMLSLIVTGIILYQRRKIFQSRWYLHICTLCAPVGFIALIMGWFTAELGRQPWVIYHFLRTTSAHSEIKFYNVIISLVLIIIVYGIIFGYFYFKYFFEIIKIGPAKELESTDETFFYLYPKIPNKIT